MTGETAHTFAQRALAAREAFPRDRGGLTAADRVAAVIPPLVVYVQMTAIGANTTFLSSLAAVLDIGGALLVAALLWGRIPARFWSSLGWPAGLFLAAFSWAAVGLSPLGRLDWAAAYLHEGGAVSMSLTPDRTLLELSKLLGAGALALAGAAVASSPRRLRLCVMALLVLGALHTLGGLILFAADPDTVVGLSKGAHRWRFTGTLLNGNAAAASMAMTCVLAAGYLRGVMRRLQQTPSGARSRAIVRLAVAGTLIFLVGGATALTTSRTALMAEIVAVFTVLFWPSANARVREGQRQATGRISGTVWGVAAAAICLAFAVFLTQGDTLGRAATLGGDAAVRLAVYRWTIGKAVAAPLFGYGLGSFGAAILQGLSPGLVDAVWNLGAAHNAWIQAAFEGGVPFAALLTLACVVAVAPALKGAPVNSVLRGMRVRLFAVLVVAAVCGSVDIALNVPAVAAQAILALGLLAGAARGTERDSRP